MMLNKKNLIVLNFNGNIITGGQVYDSMLYSTIISNSPHKIKFCEPKIYPSGINFKKILCPFIELNLLSKIIGSNICFFSSSSAYRHILLLIMVKIFLPKVSTMTIHHHYEYEKFKGGKKILFKFFELSFLKLIDSIIIPSPYVKARTEKLLPNKKIDYIEIAFKENKFIPELKDNHISELLYVGTIEPRKGIDLLLDSLFLLKKVNQNFKVNIVGDFINEAYHKKLLNKVLTYRLENIVVFHGRVSSNKLHNFFMNAELFVFPSLLEGYGMVIMEAMSYGIPVIAYNNSSIPYTIIDGFNGLLASNKNVEHFKELINKVLISKNLMKDLSYGAKNTFDKSRRELEFINDVKEFISTF